MFRTGLTHFLNIYSFPFLYNLFSADLCRQEKYCNWKHHCKFPCADINHAHLIYYLSFLWQLKCIVMGTGLFHSTFLVLCDRNLMLPFCKWRYWGLKTGQGSLPRVSGWSDLVEEFQGLRLGTSASNSLSPVTLALTCLLQFLEHYLH